MMKASKISIFKDHCKHIAGLCSSTIIIATKPAHDKLPLSTISYPYQQLVTPHPHLVTLHPHLVTLHPHLVTLHPHLVTLLSIFSYTSSTFSYTCYSKTPATMGKTYFLLKLLKTLYKNRLKVRGCYE
jgi:hypothetical protein